MSINHILNAWTQLTAFCSSLQIPNSQLSEYGLRYGLAWDATSKEQDALDKHCRQFKLVPCRYDAKLGEKIVALSSDRKRVFGEHKAVEYKVNLATRNATSPFLKRLAGDDRLSHVLVFPRDQFSHLYIASRMDDFARRYFPLLYPRHGVKRKLDASAEEVSIERKDLDYAVLAEAKVVCVHAQESLLRCFLCFLATEFFQYPKARFDFLFNHLPTQENALLCMSMMYTLLGSPSQFVSADVERFREFTRGGGQGLPDVVQLPAGVLTEEAHAYEIPLLWLLYAKQGVGHDKANTCGRHKFALTPEDMRDQALALEMARIARGEEAKM